MIAVTPNKFIDNAQIKSKGQVTIPKDVRKALGLYDGGRVTFIVENGSARMFNSAVYAMEILNKEMQGEGAKVGLNTEDDIMAMVKEMRQEG